MDRLNQAVAKSMESRQRLEYPVSRFMSKFALEQNEQSIDFIAALESHGLIKTILRVESPGGGGIQDFSSFLDVPDELYDPRTDSIVSINLSNVRTYLLLTTKEG